MAWSLGEVWLQPGQSERRWYTFGDPPSWIGPQVLFPRALNARGVLAVRDPGTEALPISLGTRYWATIVNVSPPGEWVNYSLTGGELK